jgi:hypothetical protein
MPTFFSPSGNPELWEDKPDGYLTSEEYIATLPPPVFTPPTVEELIGSVLAQLAYLDVKYLTPRVLAGLASGDSFAQGQWEKHEEECAPLRTQLASLRGDS